MSDAEGRRGASLTTESLPEPMMRLTVWLMILSLAAVACGRGIDEAATGVTTSTATSSTTVVTIPVVTADIGADTPLTVWAEPEMVPTVEVAAAEFTTAFGIEVVVQPVALNEVEDSVASGRGPDLFTGSHTWLGRLVPRGLVAPLGIAGRIGEFEPVAASGFTYQDQIYGAPYALETVALFYNTELSPQAPSSFTEMKSLCAELAATPGDETTTTTEAPATDGFSCVAAVPANPLTTLPFVTAPGGYLYGYNDDGTPNPADVGIDSDGALEGAEFLRGLVADAVIEPAEDVVALAASVAAGETAFALGGLELEDALEAAGASFEISPLPFMAGNTPQPFVEVFGFMIAGRSNQPESAALFLSDYLMAGPVMDAVAASVGKNSTFVGTTEPPAATGFLASARDGIPTPPAIDIEVSLGIISRELALLYGLEAEVGAILAAAAEPLRSLSAE